jgi:phage baseplate assembly protein W
MRFLFSRSKLLAVFSFLFFCTIRTAQCYSVLSHEAMVDALWDSMLKPILLSRFPSLAPEQLKTAHAYAYGGAIVQDMGFYPHGNGYFSDLTHYVRSGDFIAALLADAQTPEELAFALGALSHFGGDCDGHSIGTNIGEAVLYPKLARKYGIPLTYEEQPSSHLKTEFGFDVVEVAKGNYAPQAYHDFIGFNVATPLLERAFRETYGIPLSALVDDVPKAVNSFRSTVSTLVPLATRVAWAQHQDDIHHVRPGVTKRQFLYTIKRSSYERDWGKQYDRPSFWDRVLAVILKILPPIGPLKDLRYKPLTPAVELNFRKSFNVAIERYRSQLRSIEPNKRADLENLNFDTGKAMRPGEYWLQDGAYAYWLDELTKDRFASTTPAVREAVLSYYSDLTLPYATKKNKKQWRTLLLQLSELRSLHKQELATN